MRAVILALTYAFLQTDLTFTFIVGRHNPTFVLLSTQIKNIGETAEFNCSKKYVQGSPLLWTKIHRGENFGLQEILANETALFTKDSRFAIRHDTASATYFLQIKDVQETDAANYDCTIQLSVKNKWDYIGRSVNLIVRKPPIYSVSMVN